MDGITPESVHIGDNFQKLESELCRTLAQCIPLKSARRRALKAMLRGLTQSDTCLDIGTGQGGIMADCAVQGKWTFLEPDAKRLATARLLLTGEFIESGAAEFLETRRKFRVATMIDTLGYFPDARAVLRKLHTALSPRGVVIITGMDPEGHPLAFLRRRLGIEESTGAREHSGSLETRKLLEECGFKIEDQSRYGGPFTLALQTCLDLSVMRRSGNGDRLTWRSGQSSNIRRTLFVCRFIGLATWFIRQLDHFFPTHASAGFLIRARAV